MPACRAPVDLPLAKSATVFTAGRRTVAAHGVAFLPSVGVAVFPSAGRCPRVRRGGRGRAGRPCPGAGASPDRGGRGVLRPHRLVWTRTAMSTWRIGCLSLLSAPGHDTAAAVQTGPKATGAGTDARSGRERRGAPSCQGGTGAAGVRRTSTWPRTGQVAPTMQAASFRSGAPATESAPSADRTSTLPGTRSGHRPAFHVAHGEGHRSTSMPPTRPGRRRCRTRPPGARAPSVSRDGSRPARRRGPGQGERSAARSAVRSAARVARPPARRLPWPPHGCACRYQLPMQAAGSDDAGRVRRRGRASGAAAARDKPMHTTGPRCRYVERTTWRRASGPSPTPRSRQHRRRRSELRGGASRRAVFEPIATRSGRSRAGPPGANASADRAACGPAGRLTGPVRPFKHGDGADRSCYRHGDRSSATG